MRLRCHLLGCADHEFAPCCGRCGTDVYDPAYVESARAWLYPLRRRWWAARAWAWPRCHECGRRLWPWTRRVSDEFCSQACFDRWIPF
jgi:hypothetical protein